MSTAIIGLAFLGHAVAVDVLALTQTTSTFVALQHPVGLPFFGLGIAGLFIYRSRSKPASAPPRPGRPRRPAGEPARRRPGRRHVMTAGSASTLIRGARVFDGERLGAGQQRPAGRQAPSPHRPGLGVPAGAEVIDGRGRTLLPGRPRSSSVRPRGSRSG